MPADTEGALAGGMAALRRQYVEGLADTGTALCRYAQTCAAGPLADSEREDLCATAHKLAGTGKTYGFPEISRTARTLEDLLHAGSGDAEALGNALTALVAAVSDAEAPESGEIQTPPSHAPQPRQPGDRFNARPVVLVVDDDPQLRSAVLSALHDDATVLTATNAAEAMNRIADDRPDIMLLDDVMPDGMRGLKLLEHCATLTNNPLAHTKTIMITANNHAGSVRRAAGLGVVGYIAKPFTIDGLHHKLLPQLKALRAKQRTRRTVFIADDDIAIRNLLCDALGEAGFRTVFARDGSEATKLLGLENPDLMLLDIALPGRSGTEILQDARRNPRLTRTPAIMVTANRDAETVKTALKWGAADYIVKPFEIDDVVERCKRMLR